MPPKADIAQIKLVHFDRDVYEPAEDSFLLVDSLVEQLDKQSLEPPPSMCMEIGCGTGYVICSAALLLRHTGAAFLATDVNSTAAAATLQTLAAHNAHAEVVVGDLFCGMEERLAGQVDLLLFNPPYVPTPDEEVEKGGIAAAWAGGFKGRVVIDRVLPRVKQLLAPHGYMLMVLVQDNDPDDVATVLQGYGLSSEVVKTCSADEEALLILKVWHQST